MPCRSVPVVLPGAPKLLITVKAVPAMDSVGAVPGRLIDAPLLSLNIPIPLGSSEPLAVLGLITIPAVLPLAVMLAFTLTLFDAVIVKVVLALHEIASFTFTLPPPVSVPLLLCRDTSVVMRLDESAAPVISPPLAATVKS